jgi:hypothetical protein
MRPIRTAAGDRAGHWRLGVCLTCGLALLLVLAAALLAGSAAWLRGGLGLAGVVLLAAGLGLLVAHILLDQRDPPRTRLGR